MTRLRAQRLVPLLAAYPVLVTTALVLSLVAPQRGGLFGLGQVFAPHALVPVLVLIPVAVVSPSRALRVGVVLALAVGLIRFGPGLVSLPPSPVAHGEVIVSVTSWNLEAGAPAISAVMERLRASQADVVALQELTPEHAEAILADPAVTARFPHRALVPRPGVGGIGLLSRLPIESSTDNVNPVVQVVVLELPNRDLTIVNAHPFPPRYRVWDVLPLPFAYDPSQRDADILRIRETVDRAIAAGRPVLVVGDYNLTDREPAFEDLSRGLWDAHEEVGLGTGGTWRPSRLEFLPMGVLRIDHFLGGPGTRPLDVREDCTPRGSDHCILLSEAAIVGG